MEIKTEKKTPTLVNKELPPDAILFILIVQNIRD